MTSKTAAPSNPTSTPYPEAYQPIIDTMIKRSRARRDLSTFAAAAIVNAFILGFWLVFGIYAAATANQIGNRRTIFLLAWLVLGTVLLGFEAILLHFHTKARKILA